MHAVDAAGSADAAAEGLTRSERDALIALLKKHGTTAGAKLPAKDET